MFGPGDTVPTDANATNPASALTTRRHRGSAWHPSNDPGLHRVLYDRPVCLATDREWVRAWKPAVPGIHEVFHARFVDHAYPPHTHDTWTVFIVDEGAIRYDLEAMHRGAAGTKLTVLPPRVVHDGRAAGTDGFRKRVLYVGTDVLDERLIGRAVDEPDIGDPALVRGIQALHGVLEDPDDALAAETMLAAVGARLRDHLGDRPVGPADRPPDLVASDLRDLLDAHRFEPLTLREAERILHVSSSRIWRGASRWRSASHRIAYLLGRRIDAARRRLLDGEPVAQVSVGVGFHDQAHSHPALQATHRHHARSVRALDDDSLSRSAR